MDNKLFGNSLVIGVIILLLSTCIVSGVEINTSNIKKLKSESHNFKSPGFINTYVTVYKNDSVERLPVKIPLIKILLNKKNPKAIFDSLPPNVKNYLSSTLDIEIQELEKLDINENKKSVSYNNPAKSNRDCYVYFISDYVVDPIFKLYYEYLESHRIYYIYTWSAEDIWWMRYQIHNRYYITTISAKLNEFIGFNLYIFFLGVYVVGFCESVSAWYN
jgi:hypothetical protein